MKPFTVPAIGLLVLAGCASAAPEPAEDERIAPIVERDDLSGCIWEELGEIMEEERTAISFRDDGLRRAIGMAAARRGANAVIDYRQIELRQTAAAGAGATRRPDIRRASGMAVRITGGSCEAAAGIGKRERA